MKAYEKSQIEYWDLCSALDTATRKGKEEGFEKGVAEGEKNKTIEMARKLKLAGVDVSIIANTSGLSIEDVENL